MFGHICEMILALGVFYSGIVSLNQYSAEYSKSKKAIKKRKKPSLTLSFLKGAGVTVITTSSKLVMYSTSLLCFSGLMSFENAYVCILGATLTSGVSSFFALLNEKCLIYLILGCGGIMRFSFRANRHDNLKLTAMFIFSIGLLLFGILLIKDNFSFLSEIEYVRHAVMAVHHPFFAILVGTAISFIIQSTPGFVFMIAGLWGSNLISYEQSILMLYGSCVSSCIKSRLYALPFKGSARRLLLVSANISLASSIIVIGLFFLERATSIPLLNSLLRSIHKNVVFEVSGAMLVSTLFIVLLSLVFLKPLVWLYTKLYPEDSNEILTKVYYINNIESLPESQWPELMSKELDRIIANLYILVDIESSNNPPDARAICDFNDLILNNMLSLHKYMYEGKDGNSLEEYLLYERLFSMKKLNKGLLRYCDIIKECNAISVNIFEHAISIHVLLILKCLSDFIYKKTDIHELEIVAETLNFNDRKTKVIGIIKDIKAGYNTKFELINVYCDILVYMSEIINSYKYSSNDAYPYYENL